LAPVPQRTRPAERAKKEEEARRQRPGRPDDRFGRGADARKDVRTPSPGRAEPRFKPPTTGEVIRLKPPVVIRELAEQIGQKPFSVIASLMEMGIFATVNQAIDELAAQKVCAKFGFRF